MPNTFQFDSATSEQIAWDIANGCVGVAVAVSISYVNDTTLKALPDVRMLGKQGSPQIHRGTFLVEGRCSGFFNGGVYQVKERVVVLIGENARDIATVVD